MVWSIPPPLGLDDVKRDLAEGKDVGLARLARSRHHRLVENTVKEMEWWACFHEEEEDEWMDMDSPYADLGTDSLEVDDPIVPAPIRGHLPK